MNKKLMKYVSVLTLTLAIGMAVQRGNYVYVYDERNHQIFSQYGELQGYTGSTVTVKRGNYAYMYNERGHQIGSQYTK